VIPFLVADRPISLSIIKGIVLPPNARIGIMGQANTSKRFQKLFCQYPFGVNEIYPNGQPPDHRLKQQTIKMVDSGIFGKCGCRLSYEELFQTYQGMGTDYGVMIDVFKDPEGTLESAHQAMQIYKSRKWPFTLVGVAQGVTVDDYLRCYEGLIKLGFTHIAIGGLLKRRENTVRYVHVRDEGLLENVLKAVRENFDPAWLFVLGVFHPKRIALLKEYGVWGSDYKGWIFNYVKKDEMIKLINSGRIHTSSRIAYKGLYEDEVNKMSEQELRFFLVRKFIEIKVISLLYGEVG